MRQFLNAYKESFRIWVKSRTRPLTIEEAEEKKLFWSKIYAASTFVSFCFTTYYVAKNNLKLPVRKDLPQNISNAYEMSRDNTIRFISFEGFKKVSDFTMTKAEIRNLAESNSSSQDENPENATADKLV